jgi:uncharacterized membrane protein HdeD (DUF308 family)
MTDPRNDPASTPGQGGGANPQGSSGKQTRHGLFHRGSSGSSGSTTGSTATATRTTTTSTSVPQQAGQAPAREQYAQEPRYGQEYGSGYETRSAGFGGSGLAKAAKQSWAVLLLCALGMIALGIMLLVWPHASLTVVAILFGAALLVTGLDKLWEGFTARSEDGGHRAGYIVVGLIAVLAGVYLVRHHALSLFVIAFVTGVYFIMHGIADLGVAFSARSGGRGLRAVLGIFSIAAGLIMVIWPGITLVLLLTLVAAWLLFYGVVVGALAFGVRKEAKKLTERERSGTTMAAPRAA